jgi:hypothetical protein
MRKLAAVLSASIALLVLLSACGSTENPFICDGFSCGDGGPDGGKPPDNTDAGQDGGTTPDGGVTPDGGTTGCTEQWSCSYWTSTGGGTAVRICADLNACGTTNQKPSEGPVALPSLDLNFYKCNVQPVMAKSCGMVGCHGTLSPDRPFRVFARARQRNDEIVSYNPATYGCGSGAPRNINLSVEASGTASCPAKIKLTNTEWQLNFDNNRTFAIGLGSNIDSSELLVQPTRGTAPAHAGIKMWRTTDPSYQVIRNWLSGQTLATCNTGFN